MKPMVTLSAATAQKVFVMAARAIARAASEEREVVFIALEIRCIGESMVCVRSEESSQPGVDLGGVFHSFTRRVELLHALEVFINQVHVAKARVETPVAKA